MTQITLMDGSIGQELVHRSARAPTPLWSTRVMIDAPDLVAEVHADYFSAGATMATTNTYAIHRSRLVRENLIDDMPAIVETAILQAKRARDRSCPNGVSPDHWGRSLPHTVLICTLTRPKPPRALQNWPG